ncbi:MAG TPA: zinc ribbon domain-containing protein [Tepidisphaeraceae bacterium]|nr:zinc ribbon domain-containing protein [Tepidisphaeraceae bacterium]
MPIYEYTCEKCNEHFEKLVRSIQNAETVSCPKCGSTKTVRSLSVFSVGAEQNKGQSSPGGCGRCGGPGPCAMG